MGYRFKSYTRHMSIDELIREIASRVGLCSSIYIRIGDKEYEIEIDNSEKDEVFLVPGEERS